MTTPPGPPTYRKIDCNEWAIKKINAIKASDPDATPQKIYIKPTDDRVKAISDIKVAGSGDEFVQPAPAWADHYSVRHNNLYLDEQFPAGLSEDRYKARFKYLDQLSFTEVTDDFRS